MRIGIIGAMAEEVALLREAIQAPSEANILGNNYLWGKLANTEVVLVQAGIGKVNASLNVVILKQHFEVTHIINTGSAGALDDALEIGDLILAHSLTYHDVDVTKFGYQKGQMAGMPEKYYPDTELLRQAQAAARKLAIEPKIGLLLSGDQFVGDKLQKSQILDDFPSARAVDMESTAIAQAAYVLGLPFVIIRAISDNANDQANLSFDQFLDLASQMSARIVIETIINYGNYLQENN